MLRVTSLICSCLLFVSCVTSEEQVQDSDPDHPKGLLRKVFTAPFDRVWRAVQLAMIDYPQFLNSPDEGLLETETIMGDTVWVAPHKTKKSLSGVRYRIYVHVTKGNLHGQVATKVAVRKEEELHTDFFAEPRAMQSDGLEELAILYRIERELKIDEELQKQAKPKNEKAPSKAKK